MIHKIIRYSTFILIGLFAFSCRQAKNVDHGKYLHKKNKLFFETVKDGDTTYEDSYDLISEGEMFELIRPATNKKVKLFFYNRIDSTKHANQLSRKQTKYQQKNKAILEKDSIINEDRITKAKSEGKDYYNHREKKLKTVKNGWRDWVIVKLGEPPVVLDTSLVRKSNKQLDIYLYKRGFFHATVSDTILYKEKKQKAFVEYTVVPGEPYFLDSISLHPSADANMKSMYKRYLDADKSVIEVGDLVDEDKIDMERDNFSKYCRDNAAFFEFNKGYITFELDTLGRGHKAHLIMIVGPKAIEDPYNADSMLYVPHRTHKVRHVTFLMHNPDTISFKGGYAAWTKRCDSLGYQAPYKSDDGYFLLLDTLVNIDTIRRNGQQEIIFKGTYIYNNIPYLYPDLVNNLNFMEIGKYAQEYYQERSYRTMLQLDVFSSITPIFEVDPKDPLGTGVDVTYHLVPSKRQTFTIEPRITNSNSILGVSGSLNYTNKNMFRGAQKLKISFVGGLESQPEIVRIEGAEEKQAWTLNTFEWGPTIELSFPKLVPMPKSIYAKSSKRAFPSTVFNLSVNFQKREEFSRRLAHFSYEWNFKVGKTQEFKFKWINFDFVKLDKELFFEQKLDSLNDLFLSNSYADHFSLYNQIDFKFNNNRLVTAKKPNIHDLKVSFIQAGGILNATGLGVADTGSTIKKIFGVAFSQFVKIDIQYIYYLKLNKKNKIATRGLAGFGFAYGNSPSLPYEQSFFAGGSNDMRAFAARTMAPGSIRIYEDSTATTTQIGDMRLEWNIEWRFYITDILEGAFFVDMGNIWKIKDDITTTKDDLGVFAFDRFYKQVAIGTGFGIRADLEFLIVRLDVALAIHNPYLPDGEKWIWNAHPTYIATWDQGPNGNNNGIIDPIHYNKDGDVTSGNTTGDAGIGLYEEAIQYRSPFKLKFNIGIGYPF